MKLRWKRVLCVILTLCMMVTMVPGTVVKAEAAGETYSLQVILPSSSNNLLPNSQMNAEAYLNVTDQDGNSYREDSSKYTLEVESVTEENSANASTLVAVNVQSNNQIKIAANSAGNTGSCRITLVAKINGNEVARNSALVINVMNEVYEIPHALTNPDVGAVLDLEKEFVLNKVTYNPTDKSVTTVKVDLNDPNYTVTISNLGDQWEQTDPTDTTGVYNLTRITGQHANFTVAVRDNTLNGIIVEHQYEFDDLGYYVRWSPGNPASVSKTGNADFHLDVNMPGKDYTVEFVFGYGPWSQNNIIQPQNQSLYYQNTDTNRKINGICVDGAAITDARQGNDFWVKAIGYVVDSSAGRQYKVSEDYSGDINLVDGSVPSGPQYYVEFTDSHYSVSDSDTTLEMYLNLQNLPTDPYTINFVIGEVQGNGSFVSYDQTKQADLYESIKGDSKYPDRVTGIRLDIAEIKKLCNNGHFEVEIQFAVSNLGIQDFRRQSVNFGNNGPSGPSTEPPYTAKFQDQNLSIWNYETKKELLLDVSNLSGKDYNIEFAVGAFNPDDGFVAFDPSIQDDLFDPIIETKYGNTVGVCLNGAAIADILTNNQFEVQVKLTIPKENYTWDSCQTICMNSRHFGLEFNRDYPGPITVYDDLATAEILLDTTMFAMDVPDYDMDFELGTMGANGPSDYAPLATSQQEGVLFEKIIENNKVTGIALDIVAIRQVYSGEELAVKMDLKAGGYIISTSHESVFLSAPQTVYNYYFDDMFAFPEEGLGIEDNIEYMVYSGQNPEGVPGNVDVIDVTVQVTEGSADVVTVAKEDNMWMLIWNSLGAADITITHKTPDGGTETYTFTINVVDSIWKTRYWNKDGIYNAGPGGSVDWELLTENIRWSKEKGQYLADTAYELEWFVNGNPISTVSDVTVTPNGNDLTSWKISLAANAGESDYDIGYEIYELDANGNRVTDSAGNAYSVCSNFGRVPAMGDFPYLKLNVVKDGQVIGLRELSSLEVGESAVITPVAMERATGVATDVPLANATYRFLYDPEAVLIEDNGDGSYTLTRLASWEIDYNSAFCRVDAPYMGGGFATEEELYFRGMDYEALFNNTRGDAYTTWLYDDEDYTFTVDTSKLDGKRAEITFDWFVVQWIDEENGEYEEITSGYTANGASITLHGKELAAQGIESFGVAVSIKSNGYDTTYGNYIDVEMLINLQPEVEAVDKVIDHTVLTSIKAEEEVIQKIESALAAGIPVDVKPVTDNIPVSMVPERDVEEITEALEELVSEETTDSYEIVQYLDINCIATIGEANDPASEISLGNLIELPKEWEKEVKFEITIPKDLQIPGREFFVLRHHVDLDGRSEVDKLDLTRISEDKFVFHTYKFSTYALAYIDGTAHTHTLTLINAVEADCGNNGYTGDEVCTVCGEVVQKGSVIYASGTHNWSDWKKEAGIAYTFRECWNCGNSEYQNADATASGNAQTTVSVSGSPATGDTSNMVLWMMLMAVCGGVVLNMKGNRKK